MFAVRSAVLLALALAAPTPPPTPAPPLAKTGPVADAEARAFADWLVGIAGPAALAYARPVTSQELLVAGLEELYASAGQPLPDDVRAKVADSDGDRGAVPVLVAARKALGQPDAVRGARAFVIAANGFARAMDPYCALAVSTALVAEPDGGFGLGFQMEGVSGPRWLAYLLEAGGEFRGTFPPGEPRPPVGPRWVVRGVSPDGPASRGGLRVGDVVTHVNGAEVTAETNARLFRQLVLPPGALVDPFVLPREATQPAGVTLRVRRPGVAAPLDVAVRRGGVPDSVFGVTRRRDGTWDYLIDRDAKIGYVRLGAVQSGTDQEQGLDKSTHLEFARALDAVLREGARGLVLDLRWCPGGYLDATVRVAGTLLARDQVIATVKTRGPARGSPSVYTADPPPDRRKYHTLPVLVLVGGDTTGAGEMIAAALQDHGRAVVAGQRTFGRANLTQGAATGSALLTFRVTTAYTDRPSGKPRHRFPGGTPLDDWGVRPDKGYEIPTTLDLAERLKAMAERQAARPAGDTEAVPFDDPLADPPKLIAVRLLKEKLEKK